VLNAVISVIEAIVTFLQLILVGNTLCVFYSLLGLVSHYVFEKATAVRKLARDGDESKRSITHAILGLF